MPIPGAWVQTVAVFVHACICNWRAIIACSSAVSGPPGNCVKCATEAIYRHMCNAADIISDILCGVFQKQHVTGSVARQSQAQASTLTRGGVHHAGDRSEVDEEVQRDDAVHDAVDALPGRHCSRRRPSAPAVLCFAAQRHTPGVAPLAAPLLTCCSSHLWAPKPRKSAVAHCSCNVEGTDAEYRSVKACASTQ